MISRTIEYEAAITYNIRYWPNGEPDFIDEEIDQSYIGFNEKEKEELKKKGAIYFEWREMLNP